MARDETEDAKGRIIGDGSRVCVVVPEKRFKGTILAVQGNGAVMVRLEDPKCVVLVSGTDCYKLKKRTSHESDHC